MNHPATSRAGRAPARVPSSLPPVEGAALAEGPGGVVLHLRAQGGGTFRLPLSPDALREIAALATSVLTTGLSTKGAVAPSGSAGVH
ncbi:hypothetical protein ACE7GA_08965 [Roseomonas sp. CCTCC AB2023176]|uniref:hypothetical protein n=1 Tax=Roseomonas sp. CCTCC AB2023176 TaxID=3342640 RepID=UPI0035D8F7DE